MGFLGVLVLGGAAFILITAFEQLPVLGWGGALLSLAVWWLIARQLSRDGPAPLEGAIVGAVTGFVGAASAWVAQLVNLFGVQTEAGDRFGAGIGTVGASLGLLYWPLVGAACCAIFALVAAPFRSGRRDDRIA